MAFLKFVFLVFFVTSFGLCDEFESTLGHIKPRASPEIQKKAAEDLIRRILPKRFAEFKVEIDPSIAPQGKDAFLVLKAKENFVQITGSSGVAASWGFHHYLKYKCNVHISWEVEQLNLPAELPKANISIVSNDRFRYYQNVVSTGYSHVWWTWKDWEKHIDWMAMNGFNLAPAITGQELIWKRVYKKLGLTDKELEEHFAGPAFLPWNRMGNIRGWGGPLSDYFNEISIKLQKQILQRFREIGIVPVLPAFAGYIPKAITRIFPNATTRKTHWATFGDKYCCNPMLEPTDPLFNTIGSMFMKEVIAEFGTDHIYNCDTFNEMRLMTNNTEYIKSISRSVFAAMTNVDPKAVWLMQSWLFFYAGWFWTKERVKNFVNAVPKGRLLLLDLHAEQFPMAKNMSSFYGQPFIWCMLHNFGGTLDIYGPAKKMNQRVFKDRSFKNSTMVGTGLVPEGINQNYALYDLFMEMAWRKKPANRTKWFEEYATRRYGAYNKNASDAWQIIKDTVYDYKYKYKMKGKYVITTSPKLNISTWFWYDMKKFAKSWDYMLAASDSELKNSAGFRHDLVDITRQSLQTLGDIYYIDLINFFKDKKIHKFQKMVELFSELFKDLDLILSTNRAFLLGPWLEASKSLATSMEDRHIFEFNARNIITVWGPKGEVKDYGCKQWAGLVSDYYAPRWEFFMSEMNESLVLQKHFNESKVIEKMFKEIEEPFSRQNDPYPTEPKGDTIKVAKEIHSRWRKLFKKPSISLNDYSKTWRQPAKCQYNNPFI